MEALYTKTKTPEFTGTVPEFESTKRAAMLEVVNSTVNAAKSNLSELNEKLMD